MENTNVTDRFRSIFLASAITFASLVGPSNRVNAQEVEDASNPTPISASYEYDGNELQEAIEGSPTIEISPTEEINQIFDIPAGTSIIKMQVGEEFHSLEISVLSNSVRKVYAMDEETGEMIDVTDLFGPFVDITDDPVVWSEAGYEPRPSNSSHSGTVRWEVTFYDSIIARYKILFVFENEDEEGSIAHVISTVKEEEEEEEVFAATEDETDLYGAQLAEPGQFPSTVALVNVWDFFGGDLWEHLCTGSIYSKDFILLAAHCKPTNNAYILAGTTHVSPDYQGPQQMIKVCQFIPHPGYESFDKDDVALAKLCEPLEMNKQVKAIQIPPLNYVPQGIALEISGFGKFDDTELTSKDLRYGPINITPWDVCAYRYPWMNQQIICTNGPVHTGLGDSGAPLYYTHPDELPLQYAIHNASIKMVAGFHTKTAPYAEWFSSVTGKSVVIGFETEITINGTPYGSPVMPNNWGLVSVMTDNSYLINSQPSTITIVGQCMDDISEPIINTLDYIGDGEYPPGLEDLNTCKSDVVVTVALEETEENYEFRFINASKLYLPIIQN